MRRKLKKKLKTEIWSTEYDLKFRFHSTIDRYTLEGYRKGLYFAIGKKYDGMIDV